MISSNSNKLLSRIYTLLSLKEKDLILTDKEQIHYLSTVLRLRIGNYFRIFNKTDGEFIAQIINIAKDNLQIKLINNIRRISLEKELILGMSIIKNDKMLLAINMAVQLGATKIIPIVTEKCQYRNINEQKTLRVIIEATEQSERLIPATLEKITLLPTLLKQNTQHLIFFANEKEYKNNLLNYSSEVKEIDNKSNVVIMIIGPEGGFSEKERENFLLYPNCHSISLGKNILRSETAVSSGLSQVGLLQYG